MNDINKQLIKLMLRIFFRSVITFLVSAHWHGIHPGYYMSCVTIVLCMYAEDIFVKQLYEPAGIKQKYFLSWFIWFIKMRVYDYIFIAFFLLSYEQSIRYWSSIYYVIHVWALLVFSLFLASKIMLKYKKV